MDARPLKRAITVALTVAGALAGIGALVLLARAAPSLAEFERQHVLILAVNLAAAAGLTLLIAWNAWRLGRDYWLRVPGARLRARMVAVFAGLAVAPLAIVYFFAMQMLNSGIDNWFDRDLEQELATALRLSRAGMEVHARSRLVQTEGLATMLKGMSGDRLGRALGVLRLDANAEELTVFDGELRVTETSNRREQLPPSLPADAADTVRRDGRFVMLEPLGGGRYGVRALVQIPGSRQSPRYLQAVYPVAASQGQLADSVQDTYTRYAELRYLRDPLKSSLSITLSLVLLLSVLGALGGAFLLTRRLVAPIEAVARGTKAVAEGHYDTRLRVDSSDEIGFLTASFNTMLERLDRAREDSRLSQQQLERERANLASVLGRLSAGVIALSADGRIRMANDAAGAILGVELQAHAGAGLLEAVEGVPMARQFALACEPHLLRTPVEEWRGQVELRADGTRRILNCATTALSADAVTGAGAGALIVFDDVTALLRAQREAAWGEVARRLAHEIKNPLTPIRLAAERIRRRYLPSMAGEDGVVLDRSTHTIVQQVEAMRDMVNAFSDYARAPALALAPLDLNQLVREVAWLYRAQDGQPAVRLVLDEEIGMIEADALRVRQLLHNLLRNAQEALEGASEGDVELRTRRVPGERPMAEIIVSDNGPGIDPETLPRLFEPYVTTKTKGTGLGLAIVKRLVEEHGGSVAATNLPVRGARLTIRLPLRVPARESREGHRESRSGQGIPAGTAAGQRRESA